MAAITHGADAVYMGASSHGARAAAANSVTDVAAAVEFAHRYQARVYATVNTLVYESELRGVERLIGELYRAGVDALIVQDLSILRLDIPPIALHASTQCDIRTPQMAAFMERLGFSQLVLPRELTADEIRQMRLATTVPLEAFVHGALCVSYSGDCYASALATGRSANRGECAQLCRLPYDLTDGRGQTLVKGKHLLSLRDLNRLADLATMIDAGVTSFKIEGRLKDAGYVKNVVAAYHRALLRLDVERTSLGQTEHRFTPDVSRSFNRGFTSFFLNDSRPAHIASIHSPKAIGIPVAKVASVRGNGIGITQPTAPLHNGDGLTYFTPAGTVEGMRVNSVRSATLFTTNEAPRGLTPGTTLYRNVDKAFADELASPRSAVRSIGLHCVLRRAASMLCLECDGVTATVDAPERLTARTPQEAPRRQALAKLGGTEFSLLELDDRLDDEFVPSSVITDLRHRLVALLRTRIACTMEQPLRRPEQADAVWPGEDSLTYHQNVANSQARKVYTDHGVTGPIEPALEVSRPAAARELCVMQTRYCLRRELGHCLRMPAGRQWAEPLTLTAPGLKFRLEFNCRDCMMSVMATAPKSTK